MSRELMIQATTGHRSVSVSVPEQWTGPEDTSELAVLFPEGKSGIVDSFATNTVVRFVSTESPAEVFSGVDCIIADTGFVRDEVFSRREVLSASYVGETAVMQLTTMLDEGDARTLTVTSVASTAWDRFAQDIAEIHASLQLTGRTVR